MHKMDIFFLKVFSLILYLHVTNVNPQDIIFGKEDWTNNYVKIRSTTSIAPASSSQSPSQSQIDSLGSEKYVSKTKGYNYCDRKCIALDLCPYLFYLLQNPSPQHLRILRSESCGFDSDGNPLVWCNDLTCINLLYLQFNYNVSSLSKNQFLIHLPIPYQPQSSSSSSTSHHSDHKIEFNVLKSRIPDPDPEPDRENVAIASLNSAECGIAIPERISGGDNVRKSEFPWLAAIFIASKRGPQNICCGSLISDQWVLTAAHCIADSLGKLRNVSHVRLGAWNISKEDEPGAENVGVSKMYFHPEFTERPVIQNDIALIKLESKVTFGTTIGPICVPNHHSSTSQIPIEKFYNPNTISTIAGWGGSYEKNSFDILQSAKIPLVSGERCRRLFQKFRIRVNPLTQVCAGEFGRDSCKGDSGGPLMITQSNGKALLIGIVSYGTIYCNGILPGVYTKLSSYMDWVQRTIHKDLNE